MFIHVINGLETALTQDPKQVMTPVAEVVNAGAEKTKAKANRKTSLSDDLSQATGIGKSLNDLSPTVLNHPRRIGDRHDEKDQTIAMPPRVLDPCCGSKMMYFDRANPDVLFGDNRIETITVTDRSHGRRDGTRTLSIEPDMQMDFRALPFADDSFCLVSFDPPHLVRAGKKSWLAAKYGVLSEDWRDDLRAGFAECLRVLRPSGVLIFKWNETQVKVGDVLKLCPLQPLLGHLSGRKGLTHWLVFMKPNRPMNFDIPPAIRGENCDS